MKASEKAGSLISVNMISESEFTVQGHGVHTAYKEITSALRSREDIDISINTDRPVDITHIQTVGLYATRRLLRRGSKKVVSAHLVPDSFIGSLRAARYWLPLARLWLKFFYSRADLVLACSGMVRDELKNEMGLKNVELLYNTVDMRQYEISPSDRARSREQLGLSSEDFVVIGNGQIQPRKRLDTFIAIANSMPDAKFYWVGGSPFKQLGADYSKMQKMINQLPENMIVTGLIPLHEVRQYYAAADVFVLPATQENHPMCVLEAAGASLPIVLRDIPQYDDTFRGDAIMASTDEEFISAVEELRSNRDLYQKTQAGSREIAKRFDSSSGASRAVEFYRSLISNSSVVE
ncbi:hypothetical protein B7Y94_01605 [Candidatus Saccharibacteria bacterium 32-49-12]|nr:MAG: hypothetical protein B7Y94_01605 [Candidatus Saccharibacteria bacterium 32-49-12]